MRIREYLKSFGWGYFIVSCIFAIFFITKAIGSSIKDLSGLYVFISFGLLLNGGMVLALFLAVEKIMDDLRAIADFMMEKESNGSGIKTVIIEKNSIMPKLERYF